MDDMYHRITDCGLISKALRHLMEAHGSLDNVVYDHGADLQRGTIRIAMHRLVKDLEVNLADVRDVYAKRENDDN